jgi:SAM-dependent methyltransferase
VNADVDGSLNPDIICALEEPLPFGSNVFELIEAYHVVEHVYPWIVLHVLKELFRVLMPGGKLTIECPNIESACSWLGTNPDYGWNSQMGMWALYGDPNPQNPLQMHKWGYTPVSLGRLLSDSGFVKIQRQPPETHVPGRDFRLEAVKPVIGKQ